MAEDTRRGAERRRWVRFRGDVAIVKIWLPSGACREGRLVDESFGGAGIEVETTDGLAAGLDVDLEYKDTRQEAVLCSILPFKQGTHRVGFEWKDMSDIGDSALFPPS